MVFWWFWFVGWYYSVLKAFDAWVPQKRFKHWLLPLVNFFLYPCCTSANRVVVQIFVNTHSLQDIVVQKCDRCLLFNGKACNLLWSHCSSYIMSLNIWKSFGWNGPLGYFWKAAVCLLLSLRVIPYPVLKNWICSPISKGWTMRMPEQVKSGRTHQYLQNLWLLSFLSCCTERRGSLSPWAEQALTSYLGRPPHSRPIQLDTHRVDKLEGLEHVQVFIQNRQVNKTWWMGKYTLLLFFTTSYWQRHSSWTNKIYSKGSCGRHVVF